MPSLKYIHVDVFADTPFNGNSLPVFYDAPDLIVKELLAITRELRHFEAIFLQRKDDSDIVSARIFDHFEELPFAGHPIIGAAAVLQNHVAPNTSGSWTFDLSGRRVPVSVKYDGTRYFALVDQGKPEFFATVSANGEIAAAFGLDIEDLADQLPIEVASTGLRYIIVPIRPGRIAAARIRTDITTLVQRYGAQFAVLFDAATLEMRHWNNDGIIEDVATGSAAGVVGAYCHKHGLCEQGKPFELSQGRFSGRPSQLRVHVESSSNEITRVLVGGGVAFVGHGAIDLERQQLVDDLHLNTQP